MIPRTTPDRTMLRIYAYQGCSTCRNALKWLRAHKIDFEEIAIRETPPALGELRSVLRAKRGEIRALFNTSGLDYRALRLKDALPGMAESEALKLLENNGKLVKRPFAIDEARGVHLTGFKEPEWKAALLKS
jgi:arsenate reductase (glutaredoxin)